MSRRVKKVLNSVWGKSGIHGIGKEVMKHMGRSRRCREVWGRKGRPVGVAKPHVASRCSAMAQGRIHT